jgi:hypothetical protein
LILKNIIGLIIKYNKSEFDIDFKYFNTYSNSKYFTIGMSGNNQAYELIKQIPSEHSSLHNFLAARYKIMRSTIKDLNPEEVDNFYQELISTKFENKGFRYNYTIEYFKVFGQDSLANIYKDSLFGMIKDQYFIKKLN